MLAMFLVARRTKRPLNDSEKKARESLLKKKRKSPCSLVSTIYLRLKAGDSFVGQILSHLFMR